MFIRCEHSIFYNNQTCSVHLVFCPAIIFYLKIFSDGLKCTLKSEFLKTSSVLYIFRTINFVLSNLS